jgi:hypothetical protein
MFCFIVAAMEDIETSDTDCSISICMTEQQKAPLVEYEDRAGTRTGTSTSTSTDGRSLKGTGCLPPALALIAAAAKIIITALNIVWQKHLWPSMPLSTTQRTSMSTGLGNLTCKNCTIFLTHLGTVSGKRYTLMKNGDRKHGISQRFGWDRCNGIIKNEKVLGFYTPELNHSQASSTSHRSKDATGSPLASVPANLFVGSPLASSTYCNCCDKLLNKAAYTGSPSASVSVTDRAGSPSASAIYHFFDENTSTEGLRRASKKKRGIG